MIRPLRVTKRQEEERLLPPSGQSIVMPIPQPLLGDPQRLGIAGISLGRAREKAAVKLVDHADQRHPPQRRIEPMPQPPCPRRFDHRSEPPQLPIGPTAE